MEATTAVEIATREGIFIGTGHGGPYVEALDPDPKDVHDVCALLAAIGWESIPEDDQESEITERGVRIWFRRSSSDLVRALESEVDELHAQLDRLRNATEGGAKINIGREVHPAHW